MKTSTLKMFTCWYAIFCLMASLVCSAASPDLVNAVVARPVVLDGSFVVGANACARQVSASVENQVHPDAAVWVRLLKPASPAYKHPASESKLAGVGAIGVMALILWCYASTVFWGCLLLFPVRRYRPRMPTALTPCQTKSECDETGQFLLWPHTHNA